MPSRCNGCLGGSEGNTKAQSIEFDEFCTNIKYSMSKSFYDKENWSLKSFRQKTE